MKTWSSEPIGANNEIFAESGDWSPILRTRLDSSDAMIFSVSKYIRQGDVVNFWTNISVQSPPPSGNSHLEIHGLPFLSKQPEAILYYSCSVGYFRLLDIVGQITALIPSNTSLIRLIEIKDGIEEGGTNASNLTAGSWLMISGTYLANE